MIPLFSFTGYVLVRVYHPWIDIFLVIVNNMYATLDDPEWPCFKSTIPNEIRVRNLVSTYHYDLGSKVSTTHQGEGVFYA